MPSLAQTSKQIGCDSIILNLERLKKKMKKENGEKNEKKTEKKNFIFYLFFFSIFLYMDVAFILFLFFTWSKIRWVTE